MNLTLDANIIVSAVRETEVYHRESIEFLREIELREAAIYCPNLIVTECGSAIARRTGNRDLAERTVALIYMLPNLVLLPIDNSVSNRATEISISERLRAADAIYVAIAESSDSTLISWDAEILQRGGVIVPTNTPIEWINQQNQEALSSEDQNSPEENS